jgi:hypothetical protein
LGPASVEHVEFCDGERVANAAVAVVCPETGSAPKPVAEGVTNARGLVLLNLANRADAALDRPGATAPCRVTVAGADAGPLPLAASTRTEATTPGSATGRADGNAVDRAGEERARRAELRRAEHEKIVHEIATGRCDAEHVDDARSLVQETKQLANTLFSRDLWQLVYHRLLVPAGANTREKKPGESSVTLRIVSGGELHVIAMGFGKELHLEVIAGDGYPVRNRSPLGAALISMTQTDFPSRVFEARAGDNVVVNVRGFGCVTLMVLQKH